MTESDIPDLSLFREEEIPIPDPDPVVVRLGVFDSHGVTRTRYEGQLIEVEHGIPGETVRTDIVGQKRLFGHIVEVLNAAPERVEAPCPYFREWSCGGCQWQHISYEGQVAFKVEEIEVAMGRAGLELKVTQTHLMDDPWRYRATAGIGLGKRAGFRRRASLAIVPIRDCPISHPMIGDLMARLNDLLDDGALPNFRGRVRLDVRLADGPELHVLVKPDEERPPPLDEVEELARVLTTLAGVAGVSLTRRNGAIDAISGEQFAVATLDGRPVSLASGSFFQSNPSMVPRLIARLREAAGPLTGKRVADVYGGVGIFGLFLAEDAAHVTIVESDGLAVEAGRRTAASWGLTNVEFVSERAESALEDIGTYDVIVVDPPRAGLSPEVLDAIAGGLPDTVLYVSCLAQSLARDLRVLTAEGYVVEHLELFDFYPQTYHVEVLAVLRHQESENEADDEGDTLA